MTKRPRWTAEEVVQNLSDDEELDDPEEPLMEGSDDEFSDLEFDSDYDDYDNMMDVDNPGSEHTLSPPHNSPDTALHSNSDTPSSGGMSDPDSTPPSSPSTSQPSNG